MLKQRVMTAIVLFIVILAVVFLLPPLLFEIFIALVIGTAVWEWSRLAGLDALTHRFLFLLLTALLFAVITHAPVAMNVVFVTGALFWVMALVLVCCYPAGKSVWAHRPGLFLITLPLFLPGWLAFMTLRQQPYFAFHVLTLMGLVAAADSGAYFAGRAFGRHKLAPDVSPNKTWEGFFGGMLACCLLTVILALTLISQVTDLEAMHWLKLLLGAMLIAGTSVVGDLFESMAKRFRDIKDSGTILPGHGGMLDRIDGLTAAAPLYALLSINLQQDFL